MAIATTTTRRMPTRSGVCATKEMEAVAGPPDIEELVQAYRSCRKHKRSKKTALAFETELELNLYNLYVELRKGTYEIGKSTCFIVTDPKPREIWAADFRDRIIHHLLYNRLYPIFTKRFIHQSFACIPGRGIHTAKQWADKAFRRTSENYTKQCFYLKLDLFSYFNRIRKDILFQIVTEKVPEGSFLWDLLKKIILHDPRSNCRIVGPRSEGIVPSTKSLWNNDAMTGIPIGNLTSQFFSNVFLDGFDQFAKRGLKIKFYGRYVDDVLVFHQSSEYLNDLSHSMYGFLRQQLSLSANEKKTFVASAYQGVDFVGFRLLPGRIYLRRKIYHKAKQAVSNLLTAPNRKESQYNSYHGMLQHTNGFRAQQSLTRLFQSSLPTMAVKPLPSDMGI
jgi:hypothetical protein